MSRGGLVLDDEAATLAAGAALGAVLRAGDIVALAGDLGMGKTTLVRGLLRALGFTGEAASPTFPIVIPYAPPAVWLPVAHADLYRIDDPAEVEELGLDEFLDDGALVIEWPERGPAFADALRLTLQPDGPASRRLTCRRLTWVCPPPWEARWPPPTL